MMMYRFLTSTLNIPLWDVIVKKNPAYSLYNVYYQNLHQLQFSKLEEAKQRRRRCDDDKDYDDDDDDDTDNDE